MGGFVMALNANVLAALLPYLKDQLALEAAQAGLLLGIAGYAGAAGALLLGPLVDMLGRRPPMLAGMCLFVAASFMHVYAEDYQALMWARGLTGFASGVVFASTSAAVADLVPYERRGRAMGLFAAGMFLGLPAGLPLAQILAKQGWWQGVFLVQAVVGVIAFLAFCFLLPKGLGKGSAYMQNLPTLFRWDILAALVSVLLYVGAFFTAVQFSGTWLDESGLLPRDQQWLMWLVLGLATALGSLWLPRYSDAMGKRRFVLLASFAVAVCLLLLASVDSVLGLMLVGIPLAMISASRTGPFQALISDMVPMQARGTLMGVRSAFVNLGTGTIPSLGGAVYESGQYSSLLLLSAGGVLLSFVVVAIWVKKA